MAINPAVDSSRHSAGPRNLRPGVTLPLAPQEDKAKCDKIDAAVLAVIHICNRDNARVSTTIRRIDAVMHQLKQLQQDMLDLNLNVRDDEEEEVIAAASRQMSS